MSSRQPPLRGGTPPEPRKRSAPATPAAMPSAAIAPRTNRKMCIGAVYCYTVTFFESLAKPSWIPPDWAFPAAWFTLWTLQALALFTLLSSERGGRGVAIALLAAQFVTAVAWQAVIFAPGSLAFSAWWLLGVLILVVLATVAAWRVDWRAGALIAPTIVWMSVATTLGFTLSRLNPGA